jgi:hypothetical protein
LAIAQTNSDTPSIQNKLITTEKVEGGKIFPGKIEFSSPNRIQIFTSWREDMKTSLFCVLLFCLQLIFGCTAQRVEKLTPKSDLSYPLPQLESKLQVKTWDGSADLEPGLNPKDILLFEDFEDDHYQQRWRVHWNKPVGAGTVENPSQYVFAGNRSAYVENKKGKHTAKGAGEYVPETPIDDVAYFRLYLRLQDGFSTGTTNQVKLIGMRGAVDIESAYGGAGTRPTGTDGFSVALCIDNSRSLHFYYYHPDQWGGWGDITYCKISFFRKAKISPGKWYCVELMLRNNTPRQKNGQLLAWLDGKLIGHVEKIRFRDTEKVKIQRFNVQNYFGGGEYIHTSPKDQRIYIDNLVISRKPIGCLGASR